MRNEIDNDLLNFPEDEEKEEVDLVQTNCTFCLYTQGKLTKEDIRIMWDLHTSEPLQMTCTTCNKVITF